MIGPGTLINTASIAAGGVTGRCAGRFFGADQQDAIGKACGISVLFIAIAGAMEGMLSIERGSLASGRSMLPAAVFAVGAAYLPWSFQAGGCPAQRKDV